MKYTPLIRSAPFINQHTVAKATYAKEKAKQMMGAGNPLTGSANRANASTYCASCGKWHRPGNVCPNAVKSIAPMIAKGENVSHVDVMRGNPYRSGGQFAAQPGGEQGREARNACKESLSTLQDMPPQQQPEAPAPQPAPAPVMGPPATSMPIETLAPQPLINQQPQPPAPPTHADMMQRFENESQYMSGQSANYLQALRNWQARYGQ